MVNPGHRSKGCQRCRESKVKCDEATPGCGRCTRTRRICPGYGNPEQEFRSMNSTSEARVQSRVRERLRMRDLSRRVPSSGTKSRGFSRHPFNIPSPLAPDWTGQCVSIFLAEYAEQPDHLHSTWGHLEFVPDLYSKSSSVHLPEAVKAASYAHFANKSSIQIFNQLAKQSYGEALRDLSVAMKDKFRATEDETLATVNIIALYEVIAGERPFSEPFHSHYQGQSAILRMRNKNQSHSRWGKNLFATTNRGLIWRDMASLSRPHYGLVDWPPSTYPSPLAEASARMSVQAADIRGRMGQALSIASSSRGEDWRTELQSIALDALKTDHDMRICPIDVPESWQPRQLPIGFSTPSSVRQTPVHGDHDVYEEGLTPYPSRIDVYPTHGIASLWNSTRLARLHLLRAMLDLAELDAESPVFASSHDRIPSTDYLYEQTRSTVEDICASVPFVSLSSFSLLDF